jgi:tetratricopeptide (TPR) repeat protein
VRSTVWLAVFAVITYASLSAAIGADNQQWEEIFFKANQAYKEGRFNDAIDGYSQLLQSGQGSGHLYYNLGNAYFRLNDLGKATLNYERARVMLPRDEDLDFNFRYARDQLKDAVFESQRYTNQVFFWLDSLNLDELFWVFAVLNVLFWGGLLARLFIRPEWTYYFSLLLLIFWLIAGVSFGLKWYQMATDDRAVILKPELNVLAGPDIEDTTLFILHEGTVVHLERSEDGWSLVRLPDKKRGWVRFDAIERIIQRRG